MNDTIVDIRTKIVEQCSDKEKVKDLLDSLTEEVENDLMKKQIVSVDKDHIVTQKDFDTHVIYETDRGYLLSYKGGYDVVVDSRMSSAADALDFILHNDRLQAEADDKDHAEDLEVAASAMEVIFRLPMFIFSHADCTFSIASIATQYMLLLQDLGKVPTKDDDDDPKVQEFMRQLATTIDTLSEIMEEQGKEYERKAKEEVKNAKSTKPETEQKGNGKTEGKAEA